MRDDGRNPAALRRRNEKTGNRAQVGDKHQDRPPDAEEIERNDRGHSTFPWDENRQSTVSAWFCATHVTLSSSFIGTSIFPPAKRACGRLPLFSGSNKASGL